VDQAYSKITTPATSPKKGPLLDAFVEAISSMCRHFFRIFLADLYWSSVR
jgi:hypothetical protein